MKNKKTLLAIIGVVAIVLVTIGITYAYWLVTKTQTGENVISTGCLDITLNGEKNDINLTNQFPLSDEEGMELVPYEFTVTNNCNTAVDYQVNLESIGDSSTALKTTALKVAINDGTPTILGENIEAESTISGAYAANSLVVGTLEASSTTTPEDTVTYNLRIWLDADAPISEMNKTYTGKISVTVGQGINNPLKVGTLAYDMVSQYDDVNNITTRSVLYKEVKSEVKTFNAEQENLINYFYIGNSYNLNKTTGFFDIHESDDLSGLYNCIYGKESSSGMIEVDCIGKYIAYSSEDRNVAIYQITEIISENEFKGIKITAKNEYDDLKAGESFINIAKDDYGTSYYLRGDVDNNYVQFGTYQNDWKTHTFKFEENGSIVDQVDNFASLEACKNYETNNWSWSEGGSCTEEVYVAKNSLMYWRIVRVNGDGTIRLVYDGTEKKENFETNNSSIGYSAYLTNKNRDDGIYNFAASLPKIAVDKWYEENLRSVYGKYIADRIFCNDLYRDDHNPSFRMIRSYDTRNGVSPQLYCEYNEDEYTVSNGRLTNPIGMLTADEMFMAGVSNDYLSTGNDVSVTYLSRDLSAWSMTQGGYYDMQIGTSVNDFYGLSSASEHNIGIRPVINLKADVTFTGNGSYETPYVITTN